MTGFDPYAVLGVARAASPAAIKAAYRRRVRTAHPDRGGDAGEFIGIVRAFGLLADPDLRRAFDETGIVDLESLKAFRRDVATVLADMFDAAVASASGAGLKLAQVDFIALMTTAVAKGTAEARTQAQRIEAEIAALDDLSRRIKRHDDRENIFAARLSTQVKTRTEQQLAAQRRLLILETASVELGNYESDIELIAALETVE